VVAKKKVLKKKKASKKTPPQKENPDDYIKIKPVLGRPTKYRDEFCDWLVEHMSNGYSFNSFAAICGVCGDTIIEWRKEHPKFSEAYGIGLAAGLKFFERIGIKGMKGEYERFNLQAWIFLCKVRFKWNDRVGEEDTKQINSIRIQLPNAKEEEVITIDAEPVKTIKRSATTSATEKKKKNTKKKVSKK